MNPTAWIGLWAGLFVITHLGMTAAEVRPRLVNAMGEQLYQGVYSMISLATFIPLTVEFFRNKHAGPMLWNVRDEEAVRLAAIALMIAALILMVGAFATPNPTTVGLPEELRSYQPRGMLKLTRHPFFVGAGLFGVAHMVMNGWVGDLFFFGTFPIVSVVGAWHQDRRKLKQVGEAYRKFCEATSFVPGAALLKGRQRLSTADLSLPVLALGAALTVALLFAHPYIFGGHPLG